MFNRGSSCLKDYLNMHVFVRNKEHLSTKRKADLRLIAEGKSEELSITIEVVPSELNSKIFLLRIEQLQPNYRIK